LHTPVTVSCAIQQLGTVVADVADSGIGWRGLHLVGIERAQEVNGWISVTDAFGAPEIAGESASIVFGFENDGHSVVDGRHQLVRLGAQ